MWENMGDHEHPGLETFSYIQPNAVCVIVNASMYASTNIYDLTPDRTICQRFDYLPFQHRPQLQLSRFHDLQP